MTDLLEIYAAHAFWAWIALGAAILAVEVATGSGWLLWPAAAAAVVGAVTWFAGLSLPVSMLLFALLTMVTTLLARRYLPRSLTDHGHDINDNVGRLVGHHGRAVAAFDGRAGRVFIDGKEWAAELAEDAALEAGARVEVVGVHGSRLRVRVA